MHTWHARKIIITIWLLIVFSNITSYINGSITIHILTQSLILRSILIIGCYLATIRLESYTAELYESNLMETDWWSVWK